MKTEQERREAQKAATLRWKKANKEYCVKSCRRYRLKKEYGMTEEDFDALLYAQGNCCAVCHRPLVEGPDTVIDHKHGHKRPRGLLHRKCNTLLGNAEDNAIILRLAAEYLEKYDQCFGG